MVERNRQVAQMAGIYSQAERVLVWLGKEEIDQKALKFMSILFRTTEDEKDWETRQRYEKDRPVQLIPVSTGLASLTADTRWLYLDHLCRQEYWSRLWIIQEFLLATELQVYCGYTSVKWITFEVIFSGLADVRQRSPQSLDGTILRDMEQSRPVQLNHQRLDRVDKMYTSWPIVYLLFMNKRVNCYDIRDRIFGLLSLSPSCCRKNIKVDYSMSSFDLCGEVLRHHFLHHENHVSCEDRMRLSQLTHRALEAVSDIEMGQFRHKEPSIGTDLTASTTYFILVQGRIAGIVTYLSPGLETLYREKDKSSRPYSLKGLTEILRSSSATMGGEYNPFPRIKGHALSILHPTSRIEVQTSEKVLLETVLNVTPQRATELEAILQEVVKYSTEVFGVSPKYSKTRVFSGAGGVTGLAPNETKIGDFIYQFRGCDELVIFRKEDDGFRLVGGAASFHNQPKTNLLQIKGFVDQDAENFPEECSLIVHMDLDIATLQALTCF
jgi:hypothetical protein